jgi:hypothetical protein
MLRHSASNLKKVDVVHCSGETYIPHGSFGVLTLLLFLRFCFYYILREFLLLTDFFCLYTYEFWLYLWKIVRSSVILLLPLFINLEIHFVFWCISEMTNTLVRGIDFVTVSSILFLLYFERVPELWRCDIKKQMYFRFISLMCLSFQKYTKIQNVFQGWILLQWQLEPLNRNESGRFGALKSDSTHHFFRNACTKSGPLRFSQFSGCWLILSVHPLYRGRNSWRYDEFSCK